eukprot:tig00000057_g116.t1
MAYAFDLKVEFLVTGCNARQHKSALIQQHKTPSRDLNEFLDEMSRKKSGKLRNSFSQFIAATAAAYLADVEITVASMHNQFRFTVVRVNPDQPLPMKLVVLLHRIRVGDPSDLLPPQSIEAALASDPELLSTVPYGGVTLKERKGGHLVVEVTSQALVRFTGRVNRPSQDKIGDVFLYRPLLAAVSPQHPSGNSYQLVGCDPKRVLVVESIFKKRNKAATQNPRGDPRAQRTPSRHSHDGSPAAASPALPEALDELDSEEELDLDGEDENSEEGLARPAQSADPQNPLPLDENPDEDEDEDEDVVGDGSESDEEGHVGALAPGKRRRAEDAEGTDPWGGRAGKRPFVAASASPTGPTPGAVLAAVMSAGLTDPQSPDRLEEEDEEDEEEAGVPGPVVPVEDQGGYDDDGLGSVCDGGGAAGAGEHAGAPGDGAAAPGADFEDAALHAAMDLGFDFDLVDTFMDHFPNSTAFADAGPASPAAPSIVGEGGAGLGASPSSPIDLEASSPRTAVTPPPPAPVPGSLLFTYELELLGVLRTPPRPSSPPSVAWPSPAREGGALPVASDDLEGEPLPPGVLNVYSASSLIRLPGAI